MGRVKPAQPKKTAVPLPRKGGGAGENRGGVRLSNAHQENHLRPDLTSTPPLSPPRRGEGNSYFSRVSATNGGVQVSTHTEAEAHE